MNYMQKAALRLASYPGVQKGRGENAWYTLFAHVLNLFMISMQ